MAKLIKNETYTVWYNGRKYWADVEYIGRDRAGNYKMESCTYGDIYLVSRDQQSIIVNGKMYDIDSIC